MSTALSTIDFAGIVMAQSSRLTLVLLGLLYKGRVLAWGWSPDSRLEIERGPMSSFIVRLINEICLCSTRGLLSTDSTPSSLELMPLPCRLSCANGCGHSLISSTWACMPRALDWYLGSLDHLPEFLSLSALDADTGRWPCRLCRDRTSTAGGWSPRMPLPTFPADVLPLDLLPLDSLLRFVIWASGSLLLLSFDDLPASCTTVPRGVRLSSSGSSLKLNGRFAGSIFLKVMDILCFRKQCIKYLMWKSHKFWKNTTDECKPFGRDCWNTMLCYISTIAVQDKHRPVNVHI